MMSLKLRIVLLLFSVILTAIILILISKRKLPIKYSLVWISAALLICLIATVPALLEIVSKLFGFLTISNLVIGVLITLLLLITLALTCIVSHQKNQITSLIQEVSMLKKEK